MQVHRVIVNEDPFYVKMSDIPFIIQVPPLG